MAVYPHFHRHFYHGKRRFPKDFLKLPKPIRKISFIFMFYMFGWGAVIPFMSIYFKQIVGSYSMLGTIYFFFYLSATLWGFPFGEFINKASRKWTMFVVFLFYTVMGPWFIVLNGFFSVLLIRIYHGVLTSSIWTTADSYIRQYSPKKKTSEAIGFFDSAYGFGIVIGCMAGGLLMTVIGFNIFLLLSFFAFISAILTLFISGRKSKPNFVKGIRYVCKTNFVSNELKCFWKNKELVNLSLISFFLLMAMGLLTLLLPLFIVELGEGDNYVFVGLIMAVFYFPRIFETFLSRIADRNSKKLIIIIAATYAFSFFILLFLTKSKIFLFILTFLISFSFSMIFPSIEGAVTSVIPRKQIGEISGVLRTIKLGAEGLGPFIGGFISDLFGIKYIFLFGALLMVGIFISTLYIKDYRNGKEEAMLPVADEK